MPLKGFEAITANNGWAMAATGIVIVICGLALLATIISQLHRIIALFDKPAIQPAATPRVCRADLIMELKRLGLEDTANAARICCGLTVELGETFELADLHRLLAKEQFPHVHMTVRSLREGGFLIPAGGSRFSWKKG